MEIKVLKISKSAVWDNGRHIVLMRIIPTNGFKWTIVGSTFYYLAVDLDAGVDKSTDFEKLYNKFVSENADLITDEPLYLHECNITQLMKGTKYGDLKTQLPFTFYYADQGRDENASRRELRKLIIQGIYDYAIERLYQYYLPIGK